MKRTIKIVLDYDAAVAEAIGEASLPSKYTRTGFAKAAVVKASADYARACGNVVLANKLDRMHDLLRLNEKPEYSTSVSTPHVKQEVPKALSEIARKRWAFYFSNTEEWADHWYAHLEEDDVKIHVSRFIPVEGSKKKNHETDKMERVPEP